MGWMWVKNQTGMGGEKTKIVSIGYSFEEVKPQGKQRTMGISRGVW